MLLFIFPLRAQVYIGLGGGVTLPQGPYAESHMSDNQWMLTQGHQHYFGAGRGWQGCIDISVAMPFHPALELTLQAGTMRGGVNRNITDYYNIRWLHRYQQCSQYDMRLPRIVHYPILAGVRYAYPTSSTTDLYAEALCGINFRTITPWEFTYSDANWPYSVPANSDVRTYTPTNTFAFQLGAGFIIAKRVTIGASYSVLGRAPLEWERTSTARFDVYGQTITERTQTDHVVYHTVNPTILTIHLGYRLPLGSRHVQDW